MIQIFDIIFTQKLIRLTKVNLNFGTTETVVINPNTMLQALFENNKKMKEENGKFLILDRYHLSSQLSITSKHNRIKFIQMIIILFTCKLLFRYQL